MDIWELAQSYGIAYDLDDSWRRVSGLALIDQASSPTKGHIPRINCQDSNHCISMWDLGGSHMTKPHDQGPMYGG
jgi:hypothetical protein